MRVNYLIDLLAFFSVGVHSNEITLNKHKVITLEVLNEERGCWVPPLTSYRKGELKKHPVL